LSIPEAFIDEHLKTPTAAALLCDRRQFLENTVEISFLPL
jgi:hypothetical protein